MLGLMQQRPLLISSLIDYAATWHGGRQIVSRDSEGRIHRSDYSQVAARAKRVANALEALGVGHWRSRRDAGVEQLSASRDLLRHHQLRARIAHRQPETVP